MLEIAKRYQGQLGSGDDTEYIVFEVLEIDGVFVRAKRWRMALRGGACDYIGVAMLNINQFNSIEDCVSDPRTRGAIPIDELPPPEPREPAKAVPACSTCGCFWSVNRCAVCGDYFCGSHGSIERDHFTYETHYWIRCHKHPRRRSLFGLGKGDVFRTDWDNSDTYP